MSVDGVRTMEIVTPSYRPDLELCRDLVHSIRTFARQPVTHRLIVPSGDVGAFSSLVSDTVRVERVRDVLPRGLIKIPGANMWGNVRGPWPPVRGWIAQQIVKLAATAASDADAVLLVDSDVVFTRPFDLSTYAPEGRVPLYRLPGAVDGRLPRHMMWDSVARRMLGIPASSEATRPDYICWPCLWRPASVREMFARVEHVTGRPWWAAIARQLHFSEMVLYGVFIDEIAGAAGHTDDMHCVNHSDESPLGGAELEEFLRGAAPTDVAVMVSAKSGTALDERRRALRAFR
ncbi:MULTISPECIES: DUF6492 family protein [Microbacterium]|uniref:DUF6492 family protein n=1 Tax=Microbacterium TaxID=33882 RepID=UPI00197C4709|nr:MULTISPECIES: DUF6492 family protein [Microbacterium]MCK6068067.1 hypothetical protein [Microbacterium sp. EYE_512]